MKRILFSLMLVAVFASACLGAKGGLVYHEVQFVDETGAPVTDISSIDIYLPDTTTNATIYMDAALENAITQSITTTSANTTFTQSTGSLYWWGPDGYDYTFTNGTNIARNAGHRTRTSSEGRLWFPSYLADISSATYEDDETISMGDDADFVLNAGTTGDRMTVTPLTDGTSSLYLGTTSHSCDVAMWGNTTGYDLMWDASDNRLEFNDNAILGIGNDPDWYIVHTGGTTTATGALTHASAQTFSADCLFTGNAYNVEWDNSSDTLHLLDNAELGIGGDTTADGDIVLKHDGTDLDVVPAAATAIWKWGNGTNDLDMWWYGSDAADYMLWDEGAAELCFYDAHLQLNDDATLIFGSGDDWTVYSDTADTLEFDPGAAGDQLYFGTVYTDAVDITWFSDVDNAIVFFDEEAASVTFGVTDYGIDVKFWGDTDGKYASWDASLDSFEIEGQFDIGELATFGESDDTPDVHGQCYFVTHATTDTITDFDGTGIDAGQIIVVESAGAITYDVTGTGLKGGSTDIVTADGDLTSWVYNGTDWLLISYMDLSVSYDGS